MAWLQLVSSSSAPIQRSLDFWTQTPLNVANPCTQATSKAAMQLRIKIQKVLDPRKVTPFEWAIIAAYDSSPNTQEWIIAVIETTKVAVKNNEQILPNATTLNLIFSCLLASDDWAYLEIKKNFMILAELTRLEEAQIEDMSVLLEAFNDKELHH